jgi:hypothetical protein
VSEVDNAYMQDSATALYVDGSIRDKSGKHLGYFERSIDATTGTVTHENFVINDAAQGRGIAEEFYAWNEHAYAKAGFKSITMLANMDVGGYAWAKAGFHWDHETGAEVSQKFDDLRQAMSYNMAPDKRAEKGIDHLGGWKESEEQQDLYEAVFANWDKVYTPDVARALSRTPESITAWDTSRIGYDQGAVMEYDGRQYWLGKLMLLGSSWSASKAVKDPGIEKLTRLGLKPRQR